jgi:broad specificity phosphatase PhoE
MKVLIFVRHGATEWNAEGRLQGQEDIALSAEGRRQAAALAPLVARLHPRHVVCSDLRRAHETATLLGHPASVLDPRLREADLGAWTGLRSADLRATAGEQYRDWRAGRYTPPNAEPWAALCARVDAVLTELQGRAGATLIVTHGGVIRAACALLIGLQPEVIKPPSPASLTAITLEPRPRLAAFNLTPQGPLLEAPD